MLATRAVASIFGVVVVALVPACGPRVTAWNTALEELDCHASDTIVRTLKNDPGAYAVTACGQVVTYRCDEATDTCVADHTPSSAPVIAPGEPEPVVPSLEGPAPRDESMPDEPPEPTPSDEPPAEESAPEDTSPEAGDVPEPPE